MRLILIILFLPLSVVLFSQNTGLTIDKLYKLKDDSFHLIITKHEAMYTKGGQNTSTSVLYSFNDPFRYKDELGFFCKVELKWDKILYRPLRFRLGSYDYVNRLEGK